MSPQSPETFFLVNREPRGTNLSFNVWPVAGVLAPGSLKRHTPPVPISLPRGRPVDLCLLLGCSAADAETTLLASGEARTWIDKGWIDAPAMQSRTETRRAADPRTKAYLAASEAVHEAVHEALVAELAVEPMAEPMAEPMVEAPASELESMTKAELQQMAAELGLEVDDRARKGALVEALKAALEV